METKLYPGIAFSPQVILTNNIGAADTIIEVSDVSAFPPAPNLATIGTDEEGETILYAAKTSEALTGCQRGIEGTPRIWSAGELIGRNFTAKDHNDLIGSVTGIIEKLTEWGVPNIYTLIDATGSPESHRNIYRGKFLGSSVTPEQRAAIQDGTFKDLFVGDYWIINGVTWIIADMNYFYNCGDVPFTVNHLIIVPATGLYIAKMNDSNTTAGGYINSKMRTAYLNEAKTMIAAAFGDLLLTHRDFLTNAVTNGHPSGGAWVDSSVDLMNEIMVYGCYIRAAMNSGENLSYTATVCNHQLALFSLDPTKINIKVTYWLSDVCSGTGFCDVYSTGLAHWHTSSSPEIWVRPYCIIGASA